MIGPIQIDVHVHVADGDRTAKVTFGLAPGKVPDENVVLVAIGASLNAIRESLPEAELLSARDFFNHVLVKEKTGHVGNFAVSDSLHYDVDDLTRRALAAARAEIVVDAATEAVAEHPDADVEIDDDENDGENIA